MKGILFFLFVFLMVGCGTKRVEKDQFLGNWKVAGRGILDGIKFTIKKNEKGVLKGVITKLNDDKYVQLFVEPGDELVNGIERRSSYEFDLTEKRVAGKLFATYGQSSSSDLRATFKSNDTILLGKNGSEGKYIRIQ